MIVASSPALKNIQADISATIFTIKNNISYAKPNASLKEIEEAAKFSFADEFINNLPDKYDTIIGENGTRLSGGEKQRLSIARAIIKKPLLLLADEPVASLDPKSSNIILSLLKKINLEFGTTILCNLHQVDLAKKYSDRVVGLIDGKIIFDEKSNNFNEAYLKKLYS